MGSERHRQNRHPLSEVRCRAYSPAMSRHNWSTCLITNETALRREMQPEALQAIITLYLTADCHADDIHYKGRCVLNENLG